MEGRDFHKHRRSIAYHESGHTAVNVITGRYAAQITGTRLLGCIGLQGTSVINPLTQIFKGKMTEQELITFNLIGLASQSILERNHQEKIGVNFQEEHWKEKNPIQQWDILSTLKIFRKGFKAKYQRDPIISEEKLFIKTATEKVVTFIENNPVLKKLIIRLAFKNQRHAILGPWDIKNAAKYCKMTEQEKGRLRQEIQKIDFIEF